MGLVGIVAAAAITPVWTSAATSDMQRTPDHPCATDQARTCYGTFTVSDAPRDEARPMVAGAKQCATKKATYTEHGYDYPGDALYTVSLEAEFGWDRQQVGIVNNLHPQCEGAGGFKQWSCTDTRSGSGWDPGRYGGAMTAWADFTTEFHYPCPWCSEVAHSDIRLWMSPTGVFDAYAGR